MAATTCSHYEKLPFAKLDSSTIADDPLLVKLRDKLAADKGCNLCGRNPECFFMGCGRTDKRHALDHYRMRHKTAEGREHCLFLDTNAYHCWCYECDDLIQPSLFLELEPKDDSQTISNVSVSASVASTTTTSKQRKSSRTSICQLPPGVAGLYNLGNSCYMNAAIQALLNCPSIMGYFQHCAAFVYRSNHHRIAESVLKLVETVFTANLSVISPSRLVREVKMINPMFHGYTQQDTMDFIRCIFERIHEELGVAAARTAAAALADREKEGDREREKDKDDSDSISLRRRSERLAKQDPNRRNSIVFKDHRDCTGARHRSIISDTFGGVLRSEIHCQECNCISVKDDPFYDVSIQICSSPEGSKPTKPSSLTYLGNFFNSIGETIGLNGKPVRLETCLAAFCAPEALDGKDRYRCEKCNRLVRSKKSLKFKELPQVLVLQMKRFRHESYFSSKIGTHVIFPVDNLDLTPYLHEAASEASKQETRYFLSAIISHRGSFSSGHYIAYCRNQVTGQWLEFDDSVVSVVSEEDVSKVQAYILFYSIVDWNVRKEREQWLPTILGAGEGEKEREEKEKEEEKEEEGKRRGKGRVKEMEREKEFLNTGLSPTGEATDTPGIYMSRQWLNRWNTMAHPGPVDNGELLCSHGALAPEKTINPADLVQFVPRGTYDYLVSRYGECSGLGPLQEATVCGRCIEEGRELDERRKREERDIQGMDTSSIKSGEYWYLISSEWLLAWGQFKTGAGPPPGPIANDRLMVSEQPRPNLIRGTHYRGVNRRVWDYFTKVYGGGPTIVRKTINIYGPPPEDALVEAIVTDGNADDIYVDVVGH